MGIIIHFCSDVGTTWYLVWPFTWNDSVYCFLNNIWFILSRIWKILVRPCPYRPYRFWQPCLSANKYIRVSLTFKRHMTLYGTMVCSIGLVLKSVALSYTPDSEHILEIAMGSKNKQSLYEVFHLHRKDYIRDEHVTQPWPIQSLCYLFSVLKVVRNKKIEIFFSSLFDRVLWDKSNEPCPAFVRCR